MSNLRPRAAYATGASALFGRPAPTLAEHYPCNRRVLRVCKGVSTFGRTIGPYSLASSRADVQNPPNIDPPGDEPRGRAALRPSAPMLGEEDKSMTNGTVKFYNSQKGFGF